MIQVHSFKVAEVVFGASELELAQKNLKGTDICRWNVNLSILFETGYFLEFPFFWKSFYSKKFTVWECTG